MKNGSQGLWIPKEIIEDTSLKANEKILLAAITNFCKGKDGRCKAYSRTLAEATGLPYYTVGHLILELKKKGYITSQGRGLYRDLYLLNRQILIADSANINCESGKYNLPDKQILFADSASSFKEEKKGKEKGNKGEEKEASPLQPPNHDFIFGNERDEVSKNDERRNVGYSRSSYDIISEVFGDDDD